MSEEESQSQEIDRVLSEASKDEWDRWESQIQAQVDKLTDESRTLKLAMFAIGGLSLLGIGVSAMAMKAITQIMPALSQLGENQQQLAVATGLVNDPMQPTGVVKEPVVAQPDTMKDRTAPDPTVNGDAAVAPPYEGPASEASERAKHAMAKDKEAGIIDLRKEEEPS